MSEELKACPFCGGEAALEQRFDEPDYVWNFVECSQCGARSAEGSRSEVKDYWNMRAPNV